MYEGNKYFLGGTNWKTNGKDSAWIYHGLHLREFFGRGNVTPTEEMNSMLPTGLGEIINYL